MEPRPIAVVVLCVVAWVVFLFSPRAVMPLGYLAYAGFAVSLAWSALRHRREGWGCGLLFAVLLMTLPLWVMASYRLFAWLVGADPVPRISPD